MPHRLPLRLELTQAPDSSVLAAAYQYLADWVWEHEATLGDEPSEIGAPPCE